MNDEEIIKLFKEKKKILSDNKAAEMLGVSRGYISNIRRGQKDISPKIIARMARIAGPEITEAWGERCKERINEML